MEDVAGIEAALRSCSANLALTVHRAVRISGGLSRITWRLTVSGAEEGHADPRDLILQVDQSNSLVPLDNLVDEFLLCEKLCVQRGFRVARPLMRGDATHGLNGAFSLWEQIPGTAWPPELRAGEMAQAAHAIAWQSFELLGRISACDWRGLGMTSLFAPEPLDNIAQAELDRWSGIVAAHALRPLPIVAAAERWLRANLPAAPDRMRLVHGDFRLGNFMFDASGVTGVIDWEMAHLGDPHEDLGWAVLENWRFADDPHRIGGFLTLADVVVAWQQGSGLRVVPASLRWWTVLAHLKAVALWLSAAAKFDAGQVKDVTYALPGLASLSRQQRWLLTALLEAQRANLD